MKSLIGTGALVVLVVLTGCASTATPSDPSSVPPDRSTSGPPALQDPTVQVSEPVNTLTPQPADPVVAQPWSRVEPVPGTSAVLVFGTLTGGPPCAVIGRVDVTETDRSVTLTVYVGPQSAADCGSEQTQVAFPYVTRVELTAPVGDRTVRDGA